MKTIGLLALFLLASCGQAPTKVTASASAPKAPTRGTIYTKTPSWSGDREAKIPTRLGDLRVFNASNYEIDLALVGEIFDRHVTATKLEKSLELRIFPQRYVMPDEDQGFDLTDVRMEGAKNGLTISSPDTNLVMSVIPTRWATDNMRYESTCGGEQIKARAETLLTLAVTHELVGHGTKRAANVPRANNEECESQDLEDKVLIELDGRVAFRQKVAPLVIR